MLFKILLLGLVIGSQGVAEAQAAENAAGYALDDYSKEKCPICYNSRANLPAECTGDSADETRTAACGEEELCYIMKLAEGAVPRGVHTNVHQGYNANFLCATEDEVRWIKRKDLAIRDVAVSTPAPTGTTASASETSVSDPVEVSLPEIADPVLQRCMVHLQEIIGASSNILESGADAEADVDVDVDAYVDVDMDALFDPFCDALLNFTDCLSDYSGALNTEDVLRSLPHKMIRYCQTKGDLSFITNLPTGSPSETSEQTTEPTTSRITTEPTTTRRETTPTTTQETTTPTAEPTSKISTVECFFPTTEPTPEKTATPEKTRTPEKTPAARVVTKATSRANVTTSEPTAEPTEKPTEGRDIDCFKENLRTSGAVLKQVRYTTDRDCEKLCMTFDGCQAVVTSPLFWFWTECFVIGEYDLSTNDASGWDTAERKCFDDNFDEVTRPLVRTERTDQPTNSTSEPTTEPTERPTEPRDGDCFTENLRTHGTILKQIRYSTDRHCKELCVTIDGCQAVVTSPMFWYWTECFIIGDYELSTNDATGWDVAERKCFDPVSQTDNQCPSSHPNVYYNGEYCCQSNREKLYLPQGALCDGSVINRDSMCCEGDRYTSCQGGDCVSYKGEEATELVPDTLMTAEHEVPTKYRTKCTLRVVSSGEPSARRHSWYGRRETWNGDVTFSADSKDMLLIGLHPERGNVAVQNSVFRQGTGMWGYQWVDVTYPEADEEGRREYDFEFNESAFVLRCGDKVLITIPYEELTTAKEQFLSSINTVQFKLGTEEPVSIQYAQRCQDNERETRDWRDFSLSDRLNLAVNMEEEETYYVRFPCSDSIWFKLFLNAEDEQNSHIELHSKTRGNIYCNKAGFKSWYGGEVTNFNIYREWECEDDRRFMIVEVEKTSDHVAIKNRGNVLYTKTFGSRDGNCYKRTERVSTQVWNYEGSLSLAFASSEEVQEATAAVVVTVRSTTDEPEEVTEEFTEESTATPTEKTLCKDDQFTCPERCISASWRCDGESDCLDGYDEKDCAPPSVEEKEGCVGNTCTRLSSRGDFLFETDKKLTADNKEMYLIMERSGNLALYCRDETLVWESGTKGLSVGKGLVIQKDGSMVLYDEKTKQIVWDSEEGRVSYGRSENLRLVAQNDNNLVLYGDGNRVLWASGTVNQCKETPKEGGCSGDRCVVLADGDDVILAPGESIRAENGETTLLMQTDGNLVLYCSGGIPVWHSNTWYWDEENHRLIIKNTGEMVVVDKEDIQKWSSSSDDGPVDGVTLVAQNDNNLVLYSTNGDPIWQSNTANWCERY